MKRVKKVIAAAVVAVNATVVAGLLGVPGASLVTDVAGHAPLELPSGIRLS